MDHPAYRHDAPKLGYANVAPDTHKRWTVSFPDDSAFDLITANSYDADCFMERLCQLAGVDASGTTFTPNPAL